MIYPIYFLLLLPTYSNPRARGVYNQIDPGSAIGNQLSTPRSEFHVTFASVQENSARRQHTHTHTQIAKSSPSISFRHNNCVTTECSHISKAILLYAYLFSHNLLLLCCRAVRSGNVPKRKTNKDTHTNKRTRRILRSQGKLCPLCAILKTIPRIYVFTSMKRYRLQPKVRRIIHGTVSLYSCAPFF